LRVHICGTRGSTPASGNDFTRLLGETWKQQASLDVETAFEGQVIDVAGASH
jgi:hypothetical protein